MPLLTSRPRTQTAPSANLISRASDSGDDPDKPVMREPAARLSLLGAVTRAAGISELRDNTYPGGRRDCERIWNDDNAICRELPHNDQRTRCWGSANARLGACNRGKPLPPLVTWRDSVPPQGGVDPAAAAKAAAAGTALWWILSEGSRLFPPRNLIPVP